MRHKLRQLEDNENKVSKLCVLLEHISCLITHMQARVCVHVSVLSKAMVN